MALLAVTHLTPVIGVDVHLIQTFAGPTLPLPHPHVGMVFDPMPTSASICSSTTTKSAASSPDGAPYGS